MCNEPVRDLRHITPIIAAVSVTFAIIAVALRVVDAAYRGTWLHWSNVCIVLALVSVLRSRLGGVSKNDRDRRR